MISKILKAIGSFIYETIQTIVIFLSLFVFVYFFAMQPHQVQGDSMLPNFISGEYILTDKISYRFNEPKRGDVIVFKAPNNPRRDYIKRVVGLPGEIVSVKNNHIFINNKPLDEKYLSADEQIFGGAYLRNNSAIKIPNGEYFVLGDNRDQSQDSRTWGPIEKTRIVGKVFFRYWPPKEIGKVQAVTYR
jgi:signal peptidase I